ncbi:MAG: HDOD domain-containing protein [Gammaproteobacteria bacterium]|nr:HDOD domain-containing protein [Gammaproteobacteria bacterium]
MLSLDKELEQRIQAGDIDLPVLPTVSAEVLALSRSDAADAGSLAQLIQNDQALAGHVMRMANSAAYSPQGKIQTLQQAIAKLGMRQLGQMALTVSVGQSVFNVDEQMQAIAQRLWRHSLACAAWSRELARISRANTEVAFLCGLLHQIGKPVVLRALAQLQQQRATQCAYEEQVALIEKYHKLLGANLALRWQLPDAVLESIEYIDDFAGAPTAGQEVMIVSAACLLAQGTLENFAGQSIDQVIASHTIFQDLNLYQDDIANLAEKTPVVAELVSSMAV